MNVRGARQALGSCSHLLGAPQVSQSQLDEIFERQKGIFSKDQAESIVLLMRKVVPIAGGPPEDQKYLIQNLREKLGMDPAGEGIWT